MIGKFPPVLFRCLKEEEHAVKFVECGSVRFGLLDSYKNTEDKVRKDKTEGIGSLWVPGQVEKLSINPDKSLKSSTLENGQINLQTTYLNAIYIVCLSYPPNGELSLLPKKFGNYIVKINEPETFAQDLSNALISDHKELFTDTDLDFIKVDYNKGESKDNAIGSIEAFELSYKQKSSSFKDEFEYRFVFQSSTFKCEAKDHYSANIGKKLDYAEIIKI